MKTGGRGEPGSTSAVPWVGLKLSYGMLASFGQEKDVRPLIGFAKNQKLDSKLKESEWWEQPENG